MTNDGIVLFREEQHFRQPILWLGIGAGFLYALGWFGYALWRQIVLGRPLPGANPMSDDMLVVTSVLSVGLMAGMLLLLAIARLETEVRSDGIQARFFPFHRRLRHFRLEEITSCEAVRYRPLLEYGGFGIRWGMHGTAWNVSGNRGVRLEFSSRSPLLIGSRRPEEFARAVEAARQKVRPGRWS
jgi:hypothetical protein